MTPAHRYALSAWYPSTRWNLADCAAYALAKTTNAPLLFKGDDFAATDVWAAGDL